VLALLLPVLLIGGHLVARGEGDPAAPRKGRPRPQVTFKGSSPFFKVDFDRYTGVVTCVWCHPKATAIWREEETFHRDAFAILDAKARGNPECVKCHVTAYNRDGTYPLEVDESDRTGRKMGFAFGGDPDVNRHFEGVQCEACHGPNCGNKYSRERLKRGCERCHNDEYPLFKGFDFDEAVKRLKHAAVGADEKVDYDTFAGLAGCFMCHWPNYETWRTYQGPHVRAFEVLDEEGRKNPECLACHTTGFSVDGRYPREGKSGLRGGYRHGGAPKAVAKFEGVQCEACHGINCGTYTTVEQIKPRCAGCHSGACAHDEGFDFARDFEKVKHRAPEGYQADEADRKVLIEWYDLETALKTARTFRMPILVLFSNPPDG
jgi:hypothetical protein